MPDLEARLDGFIADFEASCAWRYALILLDSGEILGEVSLFPRSSDGRVAVDLADRVEIGYWLREDATGRGFATEAAQALIGVAGLLPSIESVEIRCDSRNTPSAAVPQRLGFTLADDVARTDTKMVWRQDVGRQKMG